MKTVFITGSSSGIGKAAAEYFAAQGWNVAATMRSLEKAVFTDTREIRKFRCDVTDEASVRSAVKEALAAFGSIDVCVNNAGFSLQGPFEITPSGDIRMQYETNVFGLMNVTRELLPHFRAGKKGMFINISSMAGRAGFPMYSLYNSTKFAVEGFSESLQHELRQFNIKVKIIEPGVVLTDFYGRSMVHQESGRYAAYDPYASAVIANLEQIGSRGIKPEAVARIIYKAAVSKNWKLRYTAGPDARISTLLRAVLPFGLFTRLLRSAVEKGVRTTL
ncbi:MAG: SDR family oxidoreductase [Spirochaetales bacterium]|nr:SDR family oxidoreductase [Spirochaetales bacterium]